MYTSSHGICNARNGRWWSLLSCLVAGTIGAYAMGEQCSARGVHLAVECSRNVTGHWLATVRLDQETPLSARTSRLLMDVRPTTSRCEGMRTDSLLVTLLGPPLPPDSDYEELPGFGFYKFHSEDKTWEEAKKTCEAEEAHLLILNSEAEVSAIKQLFPRDLTAVIGISVGFHDMYKEGEYVTIYGKSLATTGYNRWSPGQPDNTNGNENCGSIHSGNLGLNDNYCEHKTKFICEHNSN